jgi:hypothetical protein
MDGRAVVGEGTVNNAVLQNDCAGAVLDSVTSARVELSKDRIGRQQFTVQLYTPLHFRESNG